ncbi:MAG: hypothetical protein WCT26_05055 [Candidatus Buchananbacteria bacterium]|jgi:hypothetical protein
MELEEMMAVIRQRHKDARRELKNKKRITKELLWFKKRFCPSVKGKLHLYRWSKYLDGTSCVMREITEKSDYWGR